MRAIVLEQPGRFSTLDTQPPPQPADGEACVRVRRVGVCGTDLHAFEGKQPFFSYPRILGHEVAVEVVTAPGTAVKPGDRCALEPYLSCGQCSACRRGKPNCCAVLRVIGVHVDGAMRERFNVPVAKLHVSNTLSFDQLALAEMLAVGAHAVRRAALAASDTVLIVGTGPIGLSVGEFVRRSGVSAMLAFDTNPVRLHFCAAAMGITPVSDAANPLAGIRTALAGELPTVVFDCTGNPESMNRAFDFVEHGGRLIFVGLHLQTVCFKDPDFHRRELTVLSSRNSTPEDLQRVIAALEAGHIDVARWVTHRTSSESFIADFTGWLDAGQTFRKGIVEW